MSGRFFCSYGSHSASLHEQREVRGVTVCSACREEWLHQEALLDLCDAENDLIESGPGAAVGEALSELARTAAIVGRPTSLADVHTTALTLDHAKALGAAMRAEFVALLSEMIRRGLGMRVGILVHAVHAGLDELYRWIGETERRAA